MSKRGKPTSSVRRPVSSSVSRSNYLSIVEQFRVRILDTPLTAQLIERFRTAQAKPSARRLFLVWAILVSATVLLTLNLVRLQVFQSTDLLKQARAQQTTFLRPFVPRRPITDRSGNVLAIDRPVYTLYAHPIAFKEPKTEIATKLSEILGTSAGELLQRLNSAESGIRVEYAVSESAADRIQSLQLDGLELAQQQQRLYPQQNLVADVVGYLDIDRIGQAGVEYAHKNLLERSVKSVRLSRTGSGVMMPDRLPGGFLQVDNLHLQLSIDNRVQRAALDALQPQLKKFNAKRGVVIAMDAKTGEIRAMASDPSYDPNQFYKANVEQFKNWALTDLYEPGSTFKPINIAIALEAGAIKPDQVINDEGAIQIDGWPIQNFDYSTAGARGPSTITQIMEHSSNVGMVRIIQQMSRPTYYAWLQKIGLGKPTGIDLPFETAGQLKDQKTFLESPIDAATSSFGQGFSLTALQLVQLEGILASGGKLLTPHVAQGLFDERGQPYWQANSAEPKQIFSPQTAQTVLQMMESVVKNGTGKAAQIPNYRIGGKTGTAQKAGPNGGYIEGAKITSFVSIFPIEAPRYVVAAVIDEPKGEDAFGSTVAAPIVKAVMEALIVADKIPPSADAAPVPSPTPSP
ncbi:peptidoglycan D,D-transpeptidase FtsI family protein [Leptolyngbya sp. NIES-2104]|uniref:peptidoglycan D,D-transpeptidase FtsI family protein n=1 Tax=Leptolyngbya sp. NIES-2104 TaxID=1552121 RepID=UPI00092E9F42|nr:penicillin-binding protein 2 [Leptolyngbya sp. NIES-2104]